MRCKPKNRPEKVKQIRRGDIWFVNLPLHTDSHVQGGTRPVLVYQADRINEKSPVVNVLAVTSKLKRLDLPYHVELPWIAGLPKKSMVLAEQAFTLDKSKFFNFKCTVSEETMKEVDRARRCVERSGKGHIQSRHRKKKTRYNSKDLFKTRSVVKS